MWRRATLAALVVAMGLAGAGSIGTLVDARAGDRGAFADAFATAIRDPQTQRALSFLAYGKVGDAYRAEGKTVPGVLYPPVTAATYAALASPEALQALRARGGAVHDQLASGPVPRSLSVDLHFLEPPIARAVALGDPTGAPSGFGLPPISAGHGPSLKAATSGFRLIDRHRWLSPGLVGLAALLVAVAIVRGPERRIAVRWAGRAVTLAGALVFFATYGLQYVLARALAASSLEAQIDTFLLRELISDWWVAVGLLLLAGLTLTWFGREPRTAPAVGVAPVPAS